jgi:glycyl-tRNA synthetase beta chain
VDRELLLEIGCEELPASWLPELTNQIGEVVVFELRTHRLVAEAPAETYSTPRRLTVCIARVPERQTDLEELVNGPPVAAAFAGDGTPTRAAEGFAAKQGVEVSALERVQTPKGEYLAFRKRQRGRAAIDVLPDVLGGTLRGMSFPKSMRWDATLDDGRGDLLFGRPIRWMLFLYGGRVVPFTIARSSAAQTSQVQDVPTGAVTYGHRFLTTSGRAGRAIKVRSFEEYRARLLENFVIVERHERHNKIARELDAKAQRLHGRISRTAPSDSGLLHEVPDLVEYPSVIAGTFPPEFLSLPEEVLTTTLIHHQHYFPLEGDDGRLKNAFLAVINTEPDNERTIARNAERVVIARLRDARFFWDADRRIPFEARVDRLGTLLFHKKLGSYRDKAERIARLAEWIAREALGADPATAAHAGTAARLAKADLTTDMVREFTELQGTMGGIYAREDGQPEEVWKAIYYHYLPVGVEADAPPRKAQLGKAAVTWAAVSLADKLDTIVGLFSAGERPTGSRDPYGLRRAAQGVVRMLTDLPTLTGQKHRERIGRLIDQTAEGFDIASVETRANAAAFLLERFCYLCEARGYSSGEVRAIRRVFEDVPESLRPSDAIRRIEALRDMAGSENFLALAELFKRVKNITKSIPRGPERFDWVPLVDYSNRESREGAEKALIARLAPTENIIQNETIAGDYRAALEKLASFRPEVGRFFDEVMVMSDDERVRDIRLSIMARLRDRILGIADIAEMFGEAGQSG